MPAERQPTQKRRRLPFKPPSRASSTTAGPSKHSTGTKKPSAKKGAKPNTIASSSRSNPTAVPSDASSTSDAASDSDSTSSARNRPSSPSNSNSNSADEADYILAEITHKESNDDDVVSSEPVIPQKLLTRLLHHHFRNEKTKIAKDANAIVAKYIDVYVREAVARAAFERAESGTRGGGVGDGFLEVEDLEKMGPQLAMDF
ncbi:CENP-X/MHF2 family protein [Aspergillus lucknowensis]|uniref:CENP-S associating centromere protein X-domain-containing protein n=1 Tax=Aspergillus lucknowensis TaxID=176173 RepID=A0ABR4M5E4_9EURO